MELLRYDDSDLALAEALETDPVMMRELGGPTSLERLREAHQRRINDPWYFKIVPDRSAPAVGTIGIWDRELDGAMIWETGWMVLPAFQGRGIASAALGLLIELARAEPRFDSIHAFPAVMNVPSNALCRKHQFELLGAREFLYHGRPLHCNHWILVTALST